MLMSPGPDDEAHAFKGKWRQVTGVIAQKRGGSADRRGSKGPRRCRKLRALCPGPKSRRGAQSRGLTSDSNVRTTMCFFTCTLFIRGRDSRVGICISGLSLLKRSSGTEMSLFHNQPSTSGNSAIFRCASRYKPDCHAELPLHGHETAARSGESRWTG